jgi:ribosomal protein S30
MITPKIQQENKKNEAEEVIELLKKIERVEKLEKISQAEAKFAIPESSPTQGSAEVNLPLSYRQLARIQ